MEIEYPKEILIEKGWTKYISISVNNSGDENLHNVNVFIEGIFPDWFEFQKNKIDIIRINEKASFITKISIPYNSEKENYKFYLNINSDEISYKTDFTVSVFESREDLLLYQIQILRNDLYKLENEARKIESTGKNLTSTRKLFQEINYSLDLAENQVYNKLYVEVTETIKDVEKLFIKASFELTNPVSMEEERIENLIKAQDMLFFSFGFGILILLLSLVFLVRKIAIENKVRLPNLRLKEFIIENRRLKELEEEIEKTRESQKIIESEYRENMISKESYDELRIKYQEKILELEAEKKKIRGY